MSIVQKPLKNNNNECIVCGHSNDVDYWDTGRYLDTPYIIPQEGRLYVCVDCVRDAAKTFDFLPPDEAQALKDRNAYLEDHSAQVQRDADLAQVIKEASLTIAAGYAGVAANAPEPTIESVPDVEKVADAPVSDTLVSEDEEIVDNEGTPSKRQKS